MVQASLNHCISIKAINVALDQSNYLNSLK